MKKSICLLFICIIILSSVGFAVEDNIKYDKGMLKYVGSQNYGIDYNIIWPTSSRRITSHFGMRNGRMHYGVDVGAVRAGVKGDRIAAIAAGEVVRAEYSTSYGNVVYLNSEIEKTYIGVEPDRLSIDDKRVVPKGIEPMDYTVTLLRQSRYAHLDNYIINVDNYVSRGTKLGTMGDTATPGQVHLHFEVRDLSSLNETYPSSSAARDPLIYYPNTSFQSVGLFDKVGNFYGVEELLELTAPEITNLGISKNEIKELILDDYVKEMISESGINILNNISNDL